MMKVKVVIGVGYGDEGKGMWTDYLVRNSENPLVIRNNGGAQVGHTVVSDGKRHIFSHLGSGTLRAAPTLFTRNAVVNPVLYLKETDGRNAGLNPQVFVSRYSQVTTPYDMLLNQCTEIRRGDLRHGSTGVGFGTTLERVDDGVSLTYSDLSEKDLRSKIEKIRIWCFNRLPTPSDEFIDKAWEFFRVKDIVDLFIDDCRNFRNQTHLWDGMYQKHQTLIFENGQGLMLDQDYGDFPNVTRSSTGFRDVGQLMKKMGWFNEVPVDVYYISRCYTTRHGAGPLPYDDHSLPGIDMVDETNVPNKFQGELRLAPLNLYAMDKAIQWDRVFQPKNTLPHKIVTCCDQIKKNELAKYISTSGKMIVTDYSQFLDELWSRFDVLSYSNTGDHLVE